MVATREELYADPRFQGLDADAKLRVIRRLYPTKADTKIGAPSQPLKGMEEPISSAQALERVSQLFGGSDRISGGGETVQERPLGMADADAIISGLVNAGLIASAPTMGGALAKGAAAGVPKLLASLGVGTAAASVGEPVGEAVGEAVGLPETGSAFGGLGGFVGGAKLAGKVLGRPRPVAGPSGPPAAAEVAPEAAPAQEALVRMLRSLGASGTTIQAGRGVYKLGTGLASLAKGRPFRGMAKAAEGVGELRSAYQGVKSKMAAPPPTDAAPSPKEALLTAMRRDPKFKGVKDSDLDRIAEQALGAGAAPATDTAPTSRPTGQPARRAVAPVQGGAKPSAEAAPKPSEPQPTRQAGSSMEELFGAAKKRVEAGETGKPNLLDMAATETSPVSGRKVLAERPGPTGVERKGISSRAFRSYGYDPKERILEVEFGDGKVYRYHGVTAEEAEGIKTAKSRGAEILRLRRKYAGTKEEPAAPSIEAKAAEAGMTVKGGEAGETDLEALLRQSIAMAKAKPKIPPKGTLRKETKDPLSPAKTRGYGPDDDVTSTRRHIEAVQKWGVYGRGVKPSKPGVLSEPVDTRPRLAPNASGESSASAEAISRQASMKAGGKKFVVYDRAGNERVLIGPDAVDYKVRPGETYGIRSPEGFQVLDDKGGKVPLALRATRPKAPAAEAAPTPEEAAKPEMSAPGEPRGELAWRQARKQEIADSYRVNVMMNAALNRIRPRLNVIFGGATPTRVYVDPYLPGKAYYDASRNTIHLSMDRLSKQGPKRAAEALVHELAHSKGAVHEFGQTEINNATTFMDSAGGKVAIEAAGKHVSANLPKRAAVSAKEHEFQTAHETLKNDPLVQKTIGALAKHLERSELLRPVEATGERLKPAGQSSATTIRKEMLEPVSAPSDDLPTKGLEPDLVRRAKKNRAWMGPTEAKQAKVDEALERYLEGKRTFRDLDEHESEGVMRFYDELRQSYKRAGRTLPANFLKEHVERERYLVNRHESYYKSTREKHADDWKHSSSSPGATALKQAVQTEFKTGTSVYNPGKHKPDGMEIGTSRALVRKMYDDTQRELFDVIGNHEEGAIVRPWLKEADWDGKTLRLYRGVDKRYALGGNLESWTTSPSVARRFGRYVMEGRFTPDQILTHYKSKTWRSYGDASKVENEFIVIRKGGKAPKYVEAERGIGPDEVDAAIAKVLMSGEVDKLGAHAVKVKLKNAQHLMDWFESSSELNPAETKIMKTTRKHIAELKAALAKLGGGQK